MGTVYTDGSPDIVNVFLGTGGSSAYALATQDLLSLPGGSVISPDVLEPIIQGTDGTFYGFAGETFSRTTAGGTAAITDTPDALGFPVQLIQASDGNFYVSGTGGIAQILASDCTVTMLYQFGDEISKPAGTVEATGSEAARFTGSAKEPAMPMTPGTGLSFP